MPTFEEHKNVQAIAKLVLNELAETINSNDSERSIAQRAKAMLERQEVTKTWYYDCPALVLLGSRSCLSISGRDYEPADEKVGKTNLVSIDLSPSLNGAWGDCARSFYIENGRCSITPTMSEFTVGFELEHTLHQQVIAFASPEKTFADLHRLANQIIADAGFENLDFLGNVGHSIETIREKRQYIEASNNSLLGSVNFFTFEPHIRTINGRWGFKHENIYFFDGDFLVEL